jgi:hypothetical protein
MALCVKRAQIVVENHEQGDTGEMRPHCDRGNGKRSVHKIRISAKINRGLRSRTLFSGIDSLTDRLPRVAYSVVFDPLKEITHRDSGKQSSNKTQ